MSSCELGCVKCLRLLARRCGDIIAWTVKEAQTRWLLTFSKLMFRHCVATQMYSQLKLWHKTAWPDVLVPLRTAQDHGGVAAAPSDHVNLLDGFHCMKLNHAEPLEHALLRPCTDVVREKAGGTKR